MQLAMVTSRRSFPRPLARRRRGIGQDVVADYGNYLGSEVGAIVGIDAAWAPPLGKLRCPQDLVIATLRAANLPADRMPPNIPGIMFGLGQPMWNAPLPNGWSDEATAWAGSEAMLRRIDWAYSFAGRAARADPLVMADATLGPLLRPAMADCPRPASTSDRAAAYSGSCRPRPSGS